MSTQNKTNENKKPVFSMFGIPAIFILISGLMALVVIQGLKPPESSTRDGVIEFVQATEHITSGVDITVNVETVSVYVPKNAINEAGSIFITLREPNLFPVAGEPGWMRPQIVNVEFRNSRGIPSPEISFLSPIEICFSVNQEQWRDFSNRTKSYHVQYYAEKQNPPRWESLSVKTYPDRFQICGLTNHLSLFSLAIKLQVMVPETGVTSTPGLYEP
jgi:hypothetical protein